MTWFGYKFSTVQNCLFFKYFKWFVLTERLQVVATSAFFGFLLAFSYKGVYFHWCSGDYYTKVWSLSGNYQKHDLSNLLHYCNDVCNEINDWTGPPSSMPSSVLSYVVNKGHTSIWNSVFTQSCTQIKKTDKRRRVKKFITLMLVLDNALCFLTVIMLRFVLLVVQKLALSTNMESKRRHA